jgi:predicted secreted Zn-dependent protease
MNEGGIGEMVIRILSFIVFFFGLSLHSNEIKNCKTKFYDVYGTRNSQILKSIKQNSKLMGDDGFFGYASLKWKSKCREISIDCTVTLPRWKDAGESSKKVIENWETFYSALVLHEQGHVDIMNEHFDKAKASVADLNCKEALAVFNKAQADSSRENKAYDKKTNHGKTQGAFFNGNDNHFQAIAFSPSSGAFGFSFNQSTQAEAEALAISYCKKSDCKSVIWSRDTCASLAVGDRNAYGTAWQKERKAAETQALANCRKFGKNCKIRTTTCPN